MKVKVTKVDRVDTRKGIKVGDVYNVVRQDRDGDYYVDRLHNGRPTAFLYKSQVELVPEYVKWVRPKCDNNSVNNVVRVLAKSYTYISNVVVKVFKFLRGNK